MKLEAQQLFLRKTLQRRQPFLLLNLPRAEIISDDIEVTYESDKLELYTNPLDFIAGLSQSIGFKSSSYNLEQYMERMIMVEPSNRMSKRMSLHIGAKKDYLDSDYSDTTAFSYIIKVTWWANQKMGISLGYNRQNIHRSFGENFEGFEIPPTYYTGGAVLSSGLAKYQQDFIDAGILHKVFSI